MTRPGGRGPRRPPSCHDWSAAAARAKASKALTGSRRSSMSSARTAEVLAGEGQPEMPGEAPRPVAEPTRVDRCALVEGLVDDGDAELGVPRPRATVEVVGSDRGPDVVDDARLGVHVDGGRLVVLDPVDGDPITTRVGEQLERGLPADVLRVDGGRAVLVGVVGHDRDQPQRGVGAQRVREASRRRRGTRGTDPRRRSASAPAGVPSSTRAPTLRSPSGANG